MIEEWKLLSIAISGFCCRSKQRGLPVVTGGEQKPYFNLYQTLCEALWHLITFHFSGCRSGLLSFTLQMHLPCLILFHWVVFLSINACTYTNQRRKGGRKAHIFHLSGHSTAQSQGTSWMSWTIRGNDKSDVVHSLGKHSTYKTETGRQTLTCPVPITCVEANTQSCTHLSLSICWDNDGNLTA